MPPFPFDDAAPQADEEVASDAPLRAKLPTAALKALANEDGCIEEITPGAFGDEDEDDFLVRVSECGTDADWNLLLVAEGEGGYAALSVPEVGAGGRASFDVHASGRPVVVVDDDCCEQHHVVVAELRDGSLVEILRASALEPDRLEIVRDGAGRIQKLRVEQR